MELGQIKGPLCNDRFVMIKVCLVYYLVLDPVECPGDDGSLEDAKEENSKCNNEKTFVDILFHQVSDGRVSAHRSHHRQTIRKVGDWQ